MTANAQEYVRLIAGYKTTEEVLQEAEDDDTRRDLYEEDMSASAEILNNLIIEARRLVGEER